ncbi:MAG TPA: protein-glutamate O-methyltransferase CheR [Candidatus Binatia bacterium]|nr:protein-glutamate O-methyltransferase CheR [Candidatus Binatia bacterium]
MNWQNTNAKFEALLEFLRQSRGFDFTGYKRASLMRRVNKRMELVNNKTYDDYMDYLEVHPDEFGHLFNAILINVTSFFRDAPAWDFFRSEVIPQIVERRETDGVIRIWSAGCASGEEAYSLAMSFAEAVGIDGFQQRVKIYATDVDEEALNLARQASYSAKALEPVSDELRKKYFEVVNDRYVFRPDLRRSVIFGRHDLIQDAPISRLDLLVCRNTLMYFNAETQAGILSRFHFALNRTGFLFLGKAELLLTLSFSFLLR